MSIDAPDLVVIDFGRAHRTQFRLATMSSRVGVRHPGAAQRNRAEVGQALDLLLGVLNGQKVVRCPLRIDPVARRDHLVRGQRRDDVGDDFAFAEAQLRGARPVDIEPQSGIVEILRDVDVADAGQLTDSCRQRLRDLEIGFEIRAAHLHVDRRRQSQIQHRVHQAARLRNTRASSGSSSSRRSFNSAMYS